MHEPLARLRSDTGTKRALCLVSYCYQEKSQSGSLARVPLKYSIYSDYSLQMNWMQMVQARPIKTGRPGSFNLSDAVPGCLMPETRDFLSSLLHTIPKHMAYVFIPLAPI